MSVFTTELIAIEHAINWITENIIPYSVIFTDSLSSVQALRAGKSRTRPDKINRLLTLLDSAKFKGSVIQIEWISSHVDMDGNEIADFTAKKAMINGAEDKTRPAKTEIYSVINKAIMTKWQQQFDHPLPDKKGTRHYKGRQYYQLQRNVKKDAVMYISDRLHDKVYTRLRLGHSRLGLHCKWEKEGICKQCDDQSFEDDLHVFFDCPAYTDDRKELESTKNKSMFKLGYKQVLPETLLNTPRKHLHEVVKAVIKFLKGTGCLDRI